jgi:hypothetical protein
MRTINENVSVPVLGGMNTDTMGMRLVAEITSRRLALCLWLELQIGKVIPNILCGLNQHIYQRIVISHSHAEHGRTVSNEASHQWSLLRLTSPMCYSPFNCQHNKQCWYIVMPCQLKFLLPLQRWFMNVTYHATLKKQGWSENRSEVIW